MADAPKHHRARKRFGQHFLVSPQVISQIVGLVNPRSGMRVIEVGPGKGAITLPMIERGAEVWAVELDRDLAASLKRHESDTGLHVVQTDFLGFEPPLDVLPQFTLVGNLPYNITSPVIDWCVRHFARIERAVFMVQDELAKRIAGQPGSKDWSPLSIFTQMLFEVERHFRVAPDNFEPPPKVQSAVITLTPKENVMVPSPELERVVRTAFKHRRKTLVNNLVPDIVSELTMAKGLLGQVPLPLNCRAEQVGTEQFLTLTDLLVAHKLV